MTDRTSLPNTIEGTNERFGTQNIMVPSYHNESFIKQITRSEQLSNKSPKDNSLTHYRSNSNP